MWTKLADPMTLVFQDNVEIELGNWCMSESQNHNEVTETVRSGNGEEL